jgi:hypothetical protein
MTVLSQKTYYGSFKTSRLRRKTPVHSPQSASLPSAYLPPMTERSQSGGSSKQGICHESAGIMGMPGLMLQGTR